VVKSFIYKIGGVEMFKNNDIYPRRLHGAFSPLFDNFVRSYFRCVIKHYSNYFMM